ncbi:hypothetical protein AC1031_001229 [Aphanomyces cochlioides]|nr:hypothetical protein AC1031_001229 [Aphanomyces cochlioides]
MAVKFQKKHELQYALQIDERDDKGNVTSVDYQTMFNDGWDALGTAQYQSLRQYAAGLATVFPNTTSVESDFSILKWEKDEFRSSMLDLSLEGIFQAKQFDSLMNV